MRGISIETKIRIIGHSRRFGLRISLGSIRVSGSASSGFVENNLISSIGEDRESLLLALKISVPE
jgi:hypothetical protein